MNPQIFANVSAHGVTGTWLDEIIELGLPIALFIGMYWWSSRKEKRERRAAADVRPVLGPPGGDPPKE